MGISAAIAAAATVGSSLISGISQNKAANTAANAADQASATQLNMYNQTRGDLMPYMQTGNSALSQLASLWGLGPGGNGVPNAAAATSALTQFPGYQFGLQQGTTALDQSLAAKGQVLSGGQMEAQQQFGQNYAMQQAWNPYISQLNSLSSLGEDAGAKVGNIGVQAASNAGTAQLAAGAAQGSGILGVGNTLASALGGLSSYGGGATTPGAGPGVGFGSGASDISFDPNAANYFPG